jgi:signal transduction histidine kinase
MRARTYGLLLLLAVGIGPIAVYGWVGVERSERTAVSEVRDGNERVANSIAARIEEHIASERKVLAAIGAAVSLATKPQFALESYTLSTPNYTRLEVSWSDGQVLVAESPSNASYAHILSLTEQIVVAGETRGKITAAVDLVGIWPAVESVRVGNTGFIRLMDETGVLLAHGNPEESRGVYTDDTKVNARLIKAAAADKVAKNQQGTKVIVSAAEVKGLGWVVLVEQSVDEAFAATNTMKRDLLILGGVALLFVIALGLIFGRVMVRGLERLRDHTKILARGDLDARADARTNLVEVRALADSLNDMSSSLKELQEEAQRKERLNTFARVAAGLAHDLRHPIETLLSACRDLDARPDDPKAAEFVRKVGNRDLPRLKGYVDDLQRLAKRGDLALDLSAVKPVSLARDVAEELASSKKWSGAVSFDVASEQDEANAAMLDQNLVRRAVLNLAGNGADACLEKGPGGTVTIGVSAHNGEVRFDVSDTGDGMPPDRVAQLLHGDFHSTKRSTGVGLGLGVVRQVAASHHGRLEVVSDVGQGSTFSLVVPRVERPGA